MTLYSLILQCAFPKTKTVWFILLEYSDEVWGILHGLKIFIYSVVYIPIFLNAPIISLVAFSPLSSGSSEGSSSEGI